jgi:hypothetical protein
VNHVASFLALKDKGGLASEGWSSLTNPEEALNLVHKQKNWDPAFLALVKQSTPKSVNNWRLMWRNPQPLWTLPKGRVIQIGDSAQYVTLPPSLQSNSNPLF